MSNSIGKKSNSFDVSHIEIGVNNVFTMRKNIIMM
jgi:hypothetical protein